jgi:hypothetical protein
MFTIVVTSPAPEHEWCNAMICIYRYCHMPLRTGVRVDFPFVTHIVYFYENYFMAPILIILIIVVITAFVLYIINTYIPMNQPTKNIINILLIIAALVWIIYIVLRA